MKTNHNRYLIPFSDILPDLFQGMHDRIAEPQLSVQVKKKKKKKKKILGPYLRSERKLQRTYKLNKYYMILAFNERKCIYIVFASFLQCS